MEIQKKRGITLVALVITIIILLLLAGVTIQLALGENSLIIKSGQAKEQQTKAELYDVAKLEFATLKTSAISSNEEQPEPEDVLESNEFLSKYNVVGDNVTDKNGNIIDTVENVINMLSGGGGEANTPKVPEADRKKLVLQVNVKNATPLMLYNTVATRKNSCRISRWNNKNTCKHIRKYIEFYKKLYPWNIYY